MLIWWLVFKSLKIFTVDAALIQNLGGQWLLNENNQTNKSILGLVNLTATVPGGIYTDLMNNRIIGDILYGKNDTATRWVAKTDWTYKRNFLVDENLRSYAVTNIVFEGLDTFARVLINDMEVGRSENMFVRYAFDVKQLLQVGYNEVEVRFASPVKIGNILAERQTYPLPFGCPPSVKYHGECNVNQMRKMQASFTWDYAPAFPSMGIWQDVYLEAFNSSVVRYLVVDNEETTNGWILQVSTYLSAKKRQNVSGKLKYKLNLDTSSITKVLVVDIRAESDEVRIDFTFALPKGVIRKWWPRGYGEQKLYNLSVSFHSGAEISSKSVRVGFRTVKLIQEPVGSGLSFYFQVNNLPIFTKGANLVPAHILPEKTNDPTVLSKLLESSHICNMNMLRVSGTGFYQPDYFYDRADELGILIWQDFMFAFSTYPTHPEYLDNVRDEVRHQVKRLHGHASVVIWAGNSENELAFAKNWWGTKKNENRYKKDYVRLFINTIRSELFKLAKNTLYVTTSPTNGGESDFSLDPLDPAFGTIHFYNYYGLNSFQTGSYPLSRFLLELGYQSFPDVDAWRTVTDSVTELHPDSFLVYYRQHQVFGTLLIKQLLNYHFDLKTWGGDYFERFIFCSQINQAVSIKCAVEYYRTYMKRVNAQGLGNTMGVLFWSLNDVWVAPTWSSIDFTGKWKMLHYYAKDFFAPTIITGYVNNDKVYVYVVTEDVQWLNETGAAAAEISIFRWTSFVPVSSTTMNVSLAYGNPVCVLERGLDKSLGCSRTDCFFYLTLRRGREVVAPHNFILPTSLRFSALEQTRVEILDIKEADGGGRNFEVRVWASGVSLFVWLDSHKVRGRFSENGFLQVSAVKSVTFLAEEDVIVADLETNLTVTHLNCNK